MSKEMLTRVVHGVIHEGKQIQEGEDIVIVTAHRVGNFSGSGAHDFGGSEYAVARVDWIEPRKKNDEDKYGWWELSEGDYLVEYNESVFPQNGRRCYFQIWSAAERNGLSQPFQVITEKREPLVATLHVPAAGASIKENARISVVGLL